MADEAIDQPNLEAWFEAHVAGATPPLAFERISGGRSNLTYAVADAAGRRWALRRPPLGKRLASAHDMAREHGSSPRSSEAEVPVPPIAGLCEDESVNGAPFYVMDFVEGPILRSRKEAERELRRGRARRDRGAGRGHAGRDPRASTPTRWGSASSARSEDYVARQLHRWQGQWEKSKTRELPLIDDVHEPPVRADPRAGAGDDRARRLPARQHDPRPTPARSRPWSTGSSARSATRWPTSAC